MTILTDFDNFSLIGNRNEYYTKRVQIVSLQHKYVSTLPGKTKNNTKSSRPLTAVRNSVEPIVPDFRRKSFNVRFFPIC